MAFQFNSKVDYYELFELVMSEDKEWQELADDPEDYEEFLSALNTGKYVLK